jgi:DNA recombination protein RmuC
MVCGLIYQSWRLVCLRSDRAALEARLERIPEVSEERDLARAEVDRLRKEQSRISEEYAAYQARKEEESRSAEEKRELLEKSEERLTKEFENLANRIFEEKHKTLAEANKISVEALLEPMSQKLGDFRRRVDEVYADEGKQRASLRTEIQQLKSLNQQISTDALNLTKALKGDSQVRGTWGEIQLERLLETSGLNKGREYEIQANFKNEEGRNVRPDVIVHLPDKKDIVIDSKVSLLDYEAHHSSDDDVERQAKARAHVASVRTHFNDLSGKKYDELIGANSLDLVIMFIPIESALLLALDHEPRLYEEAFEKGVVLVSPSTLMVVLRIIHNIWRFEDQNRNALVIASEAGRLHDQFVLFVEALNKVGDQIKKAGESFDVAKNRLVDGRGNLVQRTEKLRKLGARTRKQLPADLLEEAQAESEESGLSGPSNP